VARRRASRSGVKPAASQGAAHTSHTASTPDAETAAALEETQRLLDTPLAELMSTEEERAEVEDHAREAAAVPAIASLREVVALVGSGLPATQAGNLKAGDAVALAQRLGGSGDLPEDVRTMDDVPAVAFLFRWAVAAGLVAPRGTRVVAGPAAGDLERDPLAAWLRIAIARLEHGLLDGFRRGWRKSYVELLDANVGGLLAAIAESGGTVGLAAIEDSGWEQVVEHYGYDFDDRSERQTAVRLIGALVNELAGLGVVTLEGEAVALTGLGGLLATFAVHASDDDDLDDPDPVPR